MPKFRGFTGYCGHWIQVDTSTEACHAFGPRFFHGRLITLPNGTQAMIIGAAEKCLNCIMIGEEITNEKVLYYRRINTIGIGFLTKEELGYFKKEEAL